MVRGCGPNRPRTDVRKLRWRLDPPCVERCFTWHRVLLIIGAWGRVGQAGGLSRAISNRVRASGALHTRVSFCCRKSCRKANDSETKRVAGDVGFKDVLQGRYCEWVAESF